MFVEAIINVLRRPRMRMPSRTTIVVVVVAIIMVLAFAVQITMNFEPPTTRSRVADMITSAAQLQRAGEIIAASQTPASSIAASVTPTSDNPNFDRPIPNPCPNTKKVGFESERFSAYWTEMIGSGPYPDCDKPVGWLVVINYVKNGVEYNFNMNNRWLYWLTISNYIRSRS